MGQAKGVVRTLAAAIAAMEACDGAQPQDTTKAKAAMACQVLANLAMRGGTYAMRREFGALAIPVLVKASVWTPVEAAQALKPLVSAHLRNKTLAAAPLLEACERLFAIPSSPGNRCA